MMYKGQKGAAEWKHEVCWLGLGTKKRSLFTMVMEGRIWVAYCTFEMGE